MRLPSASARAAVTCAHARCAVEHMCATVRSSELWCALPQCSMFERTADSARKNARSGPRAGDGEARPRARAAPAGAPPHRSGGGARVVTGSERAAQPLCQAPAGRGAQQLWVTPTSSATSWHDAPEAWRHCSCVPMLPTFAPLPARARARAASLQACAYQSAMAGKFWGAPWCVARAVCLRGTR